MRDTSARATAPRRPARDASGRTPAGTARVAKPPRKKKEGKAVAAVASKLPDLRAFVGKFKAPLIAVAAVLVLVLALYAPARSYYVAWRTNGTLTAQRDELKSENEELQKEYDSLLSLDGIEEEARKHGLVEEGETAIKVQGLSEDDEDDEDDGTQEEPEALPWYVSLGDLVFQYQGE